jgi:hypothetical protein
MKKAALVFCFILFTVFAGAQPHSLVKLWETDSVFRTPESVLYESKTNMLYVANMNPDHPGAGSIGRMSADGKTVVTDWVGGLTSPKGMGIYRGMLYVAELTAVAVIDIEKAVVVKRIPVEGAAFLNDITIDKKGNVYVSDSRTLKVHRIVKGIVGTLVQNLQGPNGLLAVGADLLVLDKGNLVRVTAGGQVGSITIGMDPTTDGVEEVKENEYLVSSWNGVLYYINANGNKQTLLDTRTQKINSADIGYDAKRRIVYVPTFFGNRVVAYELK